jgi:hypothetical protein
VEEDKGNKECGWCLNETGFQMCEEDETKLLENIRKKILLSFYVVPKKMKSRLLL